MYASRGDGSHRGCIVHVQGGILVGVECIYTVYRPHVDLLLTHNAVKLCCCSYRTRTLPQEFSAKRSLESKFFRLKHTSDSKWMIMLVCEHSWECTRVCQRLALWVQPEAEWNDSQTLLTEISADTVRTRLRTFNQHKQTLFFLYIFAAGCYKNGESLLTSALQSTFF